MKITKSSSSGRNLPSKEGETGEPILEATGDGFNALKDAVDKFFGLSTKFLDYFSKLEDGGLITEDDRYQIDKIADKLNWNITVTGDDEDKPDYRLVFTFCGIEPDGDAPSQIDEKDVKDFRNHMFKPWVSKLGDNGKPDGKWETQSPVKIDLGRSESSLQSDVERLALSMLETIDRDVEGIAEVVTVKACGEIHFTVGEDESGKKVLHKIMASDSPSDTLDIIDDLSLDSKVIESLDCNKTYCLDYDDQNIVIEEVPEDEDMLCGQFECRAISAIMRSLLYLKSDLEYIIWNKDRLSSSDVVVWARTVNCRVDLQIDNVSLMSSKVLGYVDHPMSYLSDKTFSSMDLNEINAEAIIVDDIRDVYDTMVCYAPNLDEVYESPLEGYIRTWRSEINCRLIL